MAIYFDQKNRIIIPRWRDFSSDKSSVDHISIMQGPFVKTDYSSHPLVIKRKTEWEEDKNLGTAWEIVNGAYITDDFTQALEAAKFLRHGLIHMPDHLKRVICQILGEPEPDQKEVTRYTGNINGIKDAVGKKIRALKVRLMRNMRSAFLWVEMARLYSIVGNNYKAERCILVALQLAKGYNRFVLRAASRFYYHLGDFGRAQNIIKTSPLLKIDPLLVSAEISYALKQGKSSRLIKLGFDQLESRKFTNAVLTELSGTLGTLEFENGAIKAARKLTRKALLAPNDNSLAQAEWIERHVGGLDIDPDLSQMEYAFEARAHENLYDHKYDLALREGVEWIIDQPFSKRACHFVSYLCVSLIDDFKLAIDACELGLLSNPNTFALVNNLAIAYAAENRVSDAQRLLPKVASIVTDDRQHIYQLALEGYLSYKAKEFDNGKIKYELAINLASLKKEHEDLKAVATAFFIKERFIAKEISIVEAKEALKKLAENEKEFVVVSQIYAIERSIDKMRRSMTV